MRIRETLQSVIEPHPILRQDAINRWNAKFDIMGRMIIAGDYVVWAGSTQTKAGEALRFFRVISTLASQKKIRVTETDDPNAFTEVKPELCLVVTEQIRHNINNPLSMPTIEE